MSKRLKHYLRNNGTPLVCRIPFSDGSNCPRQFACERDRENHERDFNHKKGKAMAMRHHSHHMGTPPKPKDEAVLTVDFLTTYPGECSKCHTKTDLLPLTDLCELCDPVLVAIAIAREEAEAKRRESEAERKSKALSIVDNLAGTSWGRFPWIGGEGYDDPELAM